MSTYIIAKRRSDQTADFYNANFGTIFADRERRTMVKGLKERNIHEVDGWARYMTVNAKPAYLAPGGELNEAAFRFIESEVRKACPESSVSRMGQAYEATEGHIVVKALTDKGELRADFSPSGAQLVKPADLEELFEKGARDQAADPRLSLFDAIFYEIYDVKKPK